VVQVWAACVAESRQETQSARNVSTPMPGRFEAGIRAPFHCSRPPALLSCPDRRCLEWLELRNDTRAPPLGQPLAVRHATYIFL